MPFDQAAGALAGATQGQQEQKDREGGDTALERGAPEQQIIALENELVDTRKAAVAILLGMAEGMARTPAGRPDPAQAFEDAARDADAATVRLAGMVAAVIRAPG